jgi:nucleoside-diphosphate-sugar epimerase
MRLLESSTYRQDVARVANLDLPWSRLRNSTLALSGASGMIGSFLVDVLMARNETSTLNCTIHAIARSRPVLAERFSEYDGNVNLRLIAADVSQNEIPIDEADYVIHAASNTHPRAYALDPIGTIMTNVHGTQAMLDLAARTSARRTVFVSTVEIYGDTLNNVNNVNNGVRSDGSPPRLAETDMGYINSNTLRAGYPESKRTGEALCQAYREHYGLDVVIPRLPRVFGPTMRMSDTKAISQFLLNAVSGQDIVLKSEGNQYFSYCHVGDAVGALLTILLRGESGEAYNVADPSCDVYLKDLAQLVASTVGTQVVFDLPNEVESRGFSPATFAVMDGTKLAALGWTPLYDIATGIERTVSVLRDIST